MNLQFFQGVRIQESALNEGYAVITYIFNNFNVEDEFDMQDLSLGVISSCILDKINREASCKSVSAEAEVYKLKKELKAEEQFEVDE